MCSVPAQCSRMSWTAPPTSWRRSSATSRLCWTFARVSTVSGWAIRSIRSRHLALHLGHRGHQTGRVAGLGEADVEAHVGPPVVLELRPLGRRHLVREVVQIPKVVLRGSLGSEHDDARLHGDPVVEHGARLPRGERVLGVVLAERRLVRDERASRAAAARDEVAALHQRGDRLAERRARDAELVGEVALRGKPGLRREQAEPDGGAEALDGLLEGGWRVDRLEYRVERGAACIHARLGHTSDRTR